MTRSDERAQALRDAGATPVVCDVFDAEGCARRSTAAQPEVVVHELTDLPPNLDPRKMEEQAAGNDRIRSEGTRNLVAAAVAAGARRMVAQSIAFAYAPGGDAAEDRGRPAVGRRARGRGRAASQALHELEDTVTQTEGIEGLVLRYGFFYGPGSRVRRRRPLRRARCAGAGCRWSGKGSGVFSFIHVDDAAAATVAAMERGAPGIYNVVDDEPGAAARVGSGLRGGAGREAAAARAGLARAAARPGRYTAAHGDRAARRLEREGQGASSAGSRATRAGAQGFREALG